MVEAEHLLWTILTLNGLNFFNYRIGPVKKCLRVFYMIGFSISLLYFTALELYFIKRNINKESIANSLLVIYSGIMWFLSYSNKKDISYVTLQIYKQRQHYKNPNKTVAYMVIAFIISMLLLFGASCILKLTLDFENFDVSQFTYGFEIQNDIWKRVFILYFEFANFAFFTAFPLYLTLFICVLFYRCSEVLKGYNINLRTQLRRNVTEILPKCIMFFYMVKLLRKLTKSFRNLSFFVILYNLHQIISIIISIDPVAMSEMKVIHIIHVGYYGTCSIVMIAVFTMSSSKIPENFVEIKTTVRYFISTYSFKRFIPKQTLFHLKRIENEDTVYITVCDMFHVTRGYILSSLGLMLTYGLLIINFKL